MTASRATKRHQTPPANLRDLVELAPAQLIALDLLDSGATHAEAAKACGKDRVTVTRWVSHHPAFIAELNRRKIERVREHERAVAELTRAAVATVGKAVADGDVRAAVDWLRLVGLAPLLPALPTEPEDIIEREREGLVSMYAASVFDDGSLTTEDAVAEIRHRLRRR